MAVSAWGEPRYTRDIDFKIQVERDEAERVLDALAPEWLPLANDPVQTLERFGMLFFQTPEGIRFDLLLVSNDFDQQAIRRGRAVETEPGSELVICSPEDLIIYKLVATRARDHADAENVVHHQGDALDDAYVIQWLRDFEQAVDDSTLVATYQGWRRRTRRG